MSRDLGDRAINSIFDFKFHTTNESSAPTTLAGTPVISIYKAGNTTQSTEGVTLTADFDSVTGLNHVQVDTTDSFYVRKTDYSVVITTGTVNSISVVGAVVATFSIENRLDRQNVICTTIATLASQTSFTLTDGSTDDDAYNGCTVLITDATTDKQKAIGEVSDYTGSTKKITLSYDPGVFTMAATDHVDIMTRVGPEMASSAALANSAFANAATGTITTNNPVDPTTNEITIIRETTYSAASVHGLLTWTVTKDYTGWTGTFTVEHRKTNASLISASVTVASSTSLTVALTATDTALTGLGTAAADNKEFGEHRYELKMVSGATKDTIGPYVAHLVKDIG